VVLSFFFDGVPVNNKSKEIAGNNSVKPFGEMLLASNSKVFPVPVFVYHPPYSAAECVKCHDKGALSNQAKPQPGLCYTCHRNFSEKFKYLHGPVAGGYCTECHAPHKAEFQKLLKRKGQQLCLRCHNVTQVLKNKAHTGIGNSDCTSCHNPHGGADRFVLNK